MLRPYFSEFINLFPQDVANENDKIKNLETEMLKSIDENYKEQKKIAESKLPSKFNFSKSEDINYLLILSLYNRPNVPNSISERISFYLSNLCECNIVLKALIIRLVRASDSIRKELENHIQRKSNKMFKLFHDFIGYCINTNQVIRDYNSYSISINHIINENSIDTNKQEIKNTRIQVYNLNIPSTSDMIDNITIILLSHNASKDRSYNLPLIRSYIEYLLGENARIKLDYFLESQYNKYRY